MGFPPTDFRTRYGFRRLPCGAVWGLDYPFTLTPRRFRCCPSSLYTFRRARWRRTAWLGIASQGFPEFEQFYVQGFPRRTQVCLSLLRLPISPRPLMRPL